jgi:hypothetical protein
VRTHVWSIYDKLGVENRVEAVTLGWNLGLLRRAKRCRRGRIGMRWAGDAHRPTTADMNRQRFVLFFAASSLTALASCTRSPGLAGDPPPEAGVLHVMNDVDAGASTVEDAGAAACIPPDASVDPDMAAAGLQAVLHLHCYGCHQSEPLDAGVVLSGKHAVIRGGYPSNLTPDLATGIGCLSDDAIVRAILDGMGPGGLLCGMPQYRAGLVDAGQTPETTARQIAQFLRSLPPVSNPVAGPCGAAVDGGTD